MGKEKLKKFTQESLISESSKGEIGAGVCLGYCIQFIKHFKKLGTSDNTAKEFGLTQGEGLKESLLDEGEKSVVTQNSSEGNVFDLFGNKNKLISLGFNVEVSKDLLADKDKTVSEIMSASRFAFHILYHDVYKNAFEKAGWHVVALKGNGWDWFSTDRIYYAMDPNQGIWRLTGSDALADWIWNDIKKIYEPFHMTVYTITG
jgi:hypothetical protein